MTADVGTALAMLVAAGPDIACTLGAGEMDGRVLAWRDVAGRVTSREAIDGGLRLGFADIDRRALANLAIREHECCAFLSFAIAFGHGGTVLEITGPPEARRLIDAIA